MVILKFNYWVAIIHLKSHCLITLLMASPVLGNDVRITDDTTPNLPNAGGHPAQHCSGPTRGGGGSPIPRQPFMSAMAASVSHHISMLSFRTGDACYTPSPPEQQISRKSSLPCHHGTSPMTPAIRICGRFLVPRSHPPTCGAPTSHLYPARPGSLPHLV